MRRSLFLFVALSAFIAVAAHLLTESSPTPTAPATPSTEASKEEAPARAAAPEPIRSTPLETEERLDPARLESMKGWFEERAMTVQREATTLMVQNDEDAQARLRALLQDFRREAMQRAKRR